jgi:O-antigen/teichoic acid export membrane protein
MPDLNLLWQNLVARARAELARRIVRDSLIVLASNLGRVALSAFVIRLLARELGPERLGVFYVMSSTVLILVTLADGGLSFSAVRRVAALRASSPDEVPAAAGAFLVLKLAFACAVVAPVWLLAEPIATNWLRVPDGPGLLRIAVLGLLATALGGWASFVTQGLRRFGWVALSQIGTTLAGLIAFSVLQALGRLTVTTAVAVGAFTPLAGGLLLVPVIAAQPIAFSDLRRHARALLSFSGWLWLSAILSSATAQLDVLLVNLWLPAEQVGFYGLAGRLALVADLLNQSNYSALLPVVSAQQTVAQHRAFMRASLLRTAPLGVLLLAGALLAGGPIVWFFGPAYAPAVPLVWLLMLGVVFDLIATPLILIAFPLGLSRVLAASDALRLATLTGALALLVPALGAAGAGWARLAARVLSTGFTLALVRRELLRRDG